MQARDGLVNGDSKGKSDGNDTENMFDSIESALADFADDKFLIVVDDEDRENEGDLIIAAENITTEQMAWLIRHSSGYICAPIAAERLDELRLELMVGSVAEVEGTLDAAKSLNHNLRSINTEKHKTAYTVTVDYKEGTTTGISAHDRALTARKLADPSVKAEAFSRPGHLCPLRARAGGVLRRQGHTEAAIDLCLLSGKKPAAVICEIVHPTDPCGSMARRDDLYELKKEWKIKMISIAALVQWRQAHS